MIKRGLIEADGYTAPLGCEGSFPRVIKRGLIEASRCSGTPVQPVTFPRVIKRGLIEAPLGRLRYRSRFSVSPRDQAGPN